MLVNNNIQVSNWTITDDTLFSSFPNEIGLHIFSFLNDEEHCQASLICRKWYILSMDTIKYQSSVFTRHCLKLMNQSAPSEDLSKISHLVEQYCQTSTECKRDLYERAQNLRIELFNEVLSLPIETIRKFYDTFKSDGETLTTQFFKEAWLSWLSERQKKLESETVRRERDFQLLRINRDLFYLDHYEEAFRAVCTMDWVQLKCDTLRVFCLDLFEKGKDDWGIRVFNKLCEINWFESKKCYDALVEKGYEVDSPAHRDGCILS